MIPWTVIDDCLSQKKRNQAWLAAELGVSVQAITNWKTRGVPDKHHRKLREMFGISSDQLEGSEPLPWNRTAGWPFPDLALLQRVMALDETQRTEIQGKLRDIVSIYEAQSGKFIASLSGRAH